MVKPILELGIKIPFKIKNVCHCPLRYLLSFTLGYRSASIALTRPIHTCRRWA